MANQIQHSDPLAQQFSDLWFDQRSTLTVEQKDALAMAYVEHALGLGKAVARGFSKDLKGAHQVISGRLRQQETQEAMIKFWTQVRRLLRRPHTYATGDIHFLANGGRDSAFEMFSQLNLENGSDLVARLQKLALVCE